MNHLVSLVSLLFILSIQTSIAQTTVNFTNDTPA